MDAKLKLICGTCGNNYSRYRDREKKNNFCSRECFHNSRIGKPSTGRRSIKEKLLVSCAYCSSPIERWRYQFKESVRHFCNLSCKGKFASLHKFAEKASNWKGGTYSTIAQQLCNSRYRRIRASVIKLDSEKCQLCGSINKLEVHHIIEKGKNPALIFDITNLITLCKKCHCRIQKCSEDYIGFFDGIVAKRSNSVEPRTGNTEPSIAQAKACVETDGGASKDMIQSMPVGIQEQHVCLITPCKKNTKSGGTVNQSNSFKIKIPIQ